MSKLFYVGDKLQSVSTALKHKPISRVILSIDEENAYYVGDESGETLTIYCPWATREMAENILAKALGFVYSPYDAVNARLDPAADVGDYATLDGNRCLLASISTSHSRSMLSSFSAPDNQEAEEEFEYMSPSQVKEYREIKRMESTIQRASDEVLIKVSEVRDYAEGIESTTNSKLSETNNKLAQLEEEAKLYVKKDGVGIEVSKVLENGVDTVKTKTGYYFGNDGLEISKSNSGTKTMLDDTGMEVSNVSSGKALLTAKGNSVVTENITSKTYFILGEKVRFENYGQDQIGCFWMGGAI